MKNPAQIRFVSLALAQEPERGLLIPEGFEERVREFFSVERPFRLEAGRAALDDFEAGPWGIRYPAIVQSWRRNWQHVIPFFAFPTSVRRIIYTTNAIEALNSKIRRAVRTRGHFPNDAETDQKSIQWIDFRLKAMKLLYLVLNHSIDAWKHAPREWFEVRAQFAIIFGDRFQG